MKNYLNESCCRFCALVFTVSVPSRKGFDVNCQKCIRSVQNADCRLQTADREQNADCRLQTGYKMQTKSK